MARVEDVTWGSYQEFEGPFYKGKIKFELPKNPSINDKFLATIVAIESGHYDAINMYDRMIVSAGLIQWGEANVFSVSKMLGFFCDSGFETIVQGCLKPALDVSGSSFKKNQKGIWRFFIGTSEVNNLAAQQKLFWGCDGKKGSWKSEESKKCAKLWAACIASILEDPRTRELQKKFTLDRLMGFVTPTAKKELFDDKTQTQWSNALRAIYLTFAINLPRVTGEMFSSTKFVGEKWSEEWCLCLIKKLTFGSNIKIYPTRYNALRPVIEKLFDVDLPQNAEELKLWDPLTAPPPSSKNVIGNSQQTINEELLKELNQIIMTKPSQPPQAPNPIAAIFKKIFSFFS